MQEIKQRQKETEARAKPVSAENDDAEMGLGARKLVLTVLLTASTVVLARFLAIRTPVISISLLYVPIMLAGMLLGGRYSMLIAVIADLIGALLFPSGSFFLGYTLTALLAGLFAGILYNPEGVKLDRRFVLRLVIYCLILCLGLNGVLNTLWIIITTGSASRVIVPLRVAKQLLSLPIYIMIMLALAKVFAKDFNRLLFAQATIGPSEVTDED